MAAFSDGSDAAVQALAVRDYFRNKYSGDPDLDGLGVRIGMHLGDAFVTMDPVTSRQTVAGRQVNLAARVEPVAPKNHVLVTDEFAGVVKHHTSRFKLSSAGFFDLPKNGGRRELFYLLRPYEAAPAVVGTAPPP
jgi:class 3 adenylate cyclase